MKSFSSLSLSMVGGSGLRVMKNFIILLSFIFSFLQVVTQLCTVGFLFFSKNKFISKKRMLKYTVKLQVILQNYNPNRVFFFLSFFYHSFGLYLVQHGKRGFHIIDGPLYCYIISSVYVTHFIS